MPRHIIVMLIIIGIIGLICFSFVLFCCVHASNLPDKKTDDEQETQLNDIGKEEL